MANMGILLFHLMLVCCTCIIAKRTLRCGSDEKRENGKCLPCPICPPGQGLLEDCGFGYGSGLRCTPCEIGITYRSDLTYKKCKLCTNCTFYNRKFLFMCRRVIDSECGECLPGYFDKQKEPSHPPNICIHCSQKPSEPQCIEYTTPLTTSTEAKSVNNLEYDEPSVIPYKAATYVLLITLVLCIIVIIYLACVLKKYVAFKYCERRNCCYGGGFPRRNFLYRQRKNSERRNLLQDVNANNLQTNEKKSQKIVPTMDTQDQLIQIHESEAQHPPSAVTVVGEQHVTCSPKVGRSISDPGPNSSQNYFSSEDIVRDSQNNERDTVVVQIPPAVVHVSCETNVPNMAVPFDSSSDVNNDQTDVNHGDINHESMSYLSIGSTLPIRDEADGNSTLNNASMFSQASTLPIRNTEEDHLGDTNNDAFVDIIEDRSLDHHSDVVSDQLSDASTLLIRNADFQDYPEFTNRNRDRYSPYNFPINVPVERSDAYNIPMPDIVEENLYDSDESEDNNNDHAHQCHVTYDVAEPIMAKSKLLQNPTTIQITINNNVTGMGPLKPNKEDKGINAVDGDDSDNNNDNNDSYNSESDNSQTLPKCHDITANRSSSSCAVAHASSMFTQFHYPIQETIKSN